MPISSLNSKIFSPLNCMYKLLMRNLSEQLIAGIGLRMGGITEKICGGAGTHVVAEHSRTGFTFPVSLSDL